MAGIKQNQSFEQRLSRQLHELSELSEVLTLRLLDLEERIKIFEANQITSNTDDTQEFTKGLLEESEVRVKHLQSLLEMREQSENTLKAVPNCKNFESTPFDYKDPIEEDCTVTNQTNGDFQSEEPFENQDDLSNDDLEYIEDHFEADNNRPLLSA